MYLFHVSVLLRLYSFYACISPGDSIFMDFRWKLHQPKSTDGTSARDKSPGDLIFTVFRGKFHRPKFIAGTSARVKSPGDSNFMDFRGKTHRPKSTAGTSALPKIKKESENGQKLRKNNKGSAVPGRKQKKKKNPRENHDRSTIRELESKKIPAGSAFGRSGGDH